MKELQSERKSNDGIKLFTVRWEPEENRKGAICLVHGLGEHCGRYLHWARLFTAKGYAVTTFDLRGHGQSAGLRGDAPSFDHLVDDIALCYEDALSLYAGLPLFLYGHSLGGLLALFYLAQRKPDFAGAIITSPAIKTIASDQKIKLFLGRLISYVAPKTTIANGLDQNNLSRDEKVVKAYAGDPLVHNKISLRLAKGMVDAAIFVAGKAADIKTPLLLLHGGKDRITYPEGTKALAELIEKDCTLKIYPDCFHELHNEPEKEAVFSFIESWLEDQANS